MKSFVFAGLSLALVSAPVLAADEAAPAKPAKPVKICKPDHSTTGSRIPKRVCKTKEQWESLEGAQDLGHKSHGGRLEGRFNVERAGPGGS